MAKAGLQNHNNHLVTPERAFRSIPHTEPRGMRKVHVSKCHTHSTGQ